MAVVAESPSLSSRRASVRDSEGGGSRGKSKSRTAEWTPWKDRITKNGHRDAVLFVQFVSGKCGSRNVQRTLVSAAADGSVRLFDLNKVGREPHVRVKVNLTLPNGGLASELLPGMVPYGAASPKRTYCTCFDFCPRFGSAAVADDEAAAPPASRSTAPSPENGSGGDDYGSQELEGEDSVDSGVAAVMFAGHDNGLIAGWDVTNQGRLVAYFPGHEQAVTALRLGPRLEDCGADAVASLISSSVDGTVRVWRVDDCGGAADDCGLGGQCLFALDFGHRNPVADFLLLPQAAPALLAVSWDGALRHVDLQRRTCHSMTQVSQVGLRALCLGAAPNAEALQVWLGSDDGEIACWNSSAATSGFERSSCWKAHHAEITGLRSWSGWLISASEDRTVRLWIAKTAFLVEELRGHAGAILALAIADGDQMLWSGARDWTIRSWDLKEAKQHLFERERMAQLDAESLAYEQELRAQARASKKGKKKKDKGAKSAKAKRR